VNVSFLPVFGPIWVFGAMCFTYLALRELDEARRAVLRDQDASPPSLASGLLIAPSGGASPPLRRSERIAVALATTVQKLWAFAIPVIAYAVLMSSYFDFVRPARDCQQWRYGTRPEQIADLLLGTGGWGGFPPCTPSIQSALEQRQKEDPKDRDRLARLAGNVPWIYPPWQTWLYVLGFLGLGLLSATGWRDYQLPARGSRRH
jgi:hypothetical protein